MGPKMPVSCENSDSAISSSIRDSLGNYNSITKASNLGIGKNQLTTSLKQSLLKKIEYIESPPGFGYSIQDSLKAKYTVLRPSEEEKTTTGQSVGGSTPQYQKNGNVTKLNGPCLPSPKQILYPRERIQIGWGNARKWSVGSGMVNLGNTCYLNSTLQALFHVPSFANWLQSDSEHRSRCEELSGSQNGCIICSMAEVLQSTQSSQGPTKPTPVYSKLRQICRHLVLGHQEDAHEFLRYLMESMEKSFLSRYKNSKEFEQYTKETTPINQIIGGYVRTSVKCLSCQYESVTFQHFEDLLLDIRKVNTIDEALKQHFARESLEEMDYTCESCKKKVSATKQFSLERAPVALCIQLKRFSGINGKISRHINITPDLDFSQYLSKDMKNRQLKYRLVSMITHLGSTPQCGHYTAIGCCQDGQYYQFDDSSVRAMSINSLLNTNPYIIFYELVPPSVNKPSPSTTITSSSPLMSSLTPSHNENGGHKLNIETSTKFIGPLLPVVNNQANKPILMPVNGSSPMKPYGSSNGLLDNRKLVTTNSNNQMVPHKKSDDTTTAVATAKLLASNGNASNETLTKNVDKSWNRSPEVESLLIVNSNNTLPIPESTAKRIIEPAATSKFSNETITKKSITSSDNSRNGNDSESKIPSPPPPPPLKVLPSMPELKSNSALRNGDIARPSRVNIQPTDRNDDDKHRDTVTPTNSLQRKLHSSPTCQGTVAIYHSPSAKMHSPNNQQRSEENKIRSPSLTAVRQSMNPFSKDAYNPVKNGVTPHKTNNTNNRITSEENRRLVLVNNRESTERSLAPMRQSMNPFSKVSNAPNKNGKHKTNGYGHSGPYNNQRNTKQSNGYVVSPSKRLVPYDDSDSNNEDRKSPPIVKTKAGPFQVTKNTTNGNSKNSSNHRNSSETRPSWFKPSNSGRVPSLNTWNGGSSSLQEEMIREQRENNKRKSERDFDMDLDMGRTKKMRHATFQLREEDDGNRREPRRARQHRNRNHRTFKSFSPYEHWK